MTKEWETGTATAITEWQGSKQPLKTDFLSQINEPCFFLSKHSSAHNFSYFVKFIRNYKTMSCDSLKEEPEPHKSCDFWYCVFKRMFWRN